MASIPPNFGQVNFVWSGQAAPRGAQVAIGIDKTTFDGDPGDAAALLLANYIANLQDLFPEDLILSGVKVKYGPNDTGPETTLATSTPGTGANDSGAPQVAVLVKKTTAIGGPTNRGRMYLPAPSEASIDSNGMLHSADIAVYQAGLTDFLAQLATDEMPMVLLHNDVGAIPTNVTGLNVQALTATQKRRIRRAGGRRSVGA